MQRVTRHYSLGEINKILDDIRFGVSNRYRQIQRPLVQGDADVAGTLSAGSIATDAFTAGNLEARRLDIKDAAGLTQNYFNEEGWMQPRYRDEYVSGPYEYGQGGAAPAVSTVNISGEDDGDGNTTLQMRLRTFVRTGPARVIYGAFEINHDVALDGANAGAHPLEAHVHYIPIDVPVAGNTASWSLDYAVMGLDEAPLIQAQVTATATLAPADASRHKIVAFNDNVIPPPTGGWKIGMIVPFALRYLAASTYAGNIGFLKAALHVPCDGLGSRQRFIK